MAVLKKAISDYKQAIGFSEDMAEYEFAEE